MTFSEIKNLVLKLNELNPGVEIKCGNPEFDYLATRRIFSSISADKLVLPDGYYYNEKNGITNKHNTDTGMYNSIIVRSINIARKEDLYNEPQKKFMDELNPIKVINEIIRLNPKVGIAVPSYGSYNTIYVSIPVHRLNLPTGFYYNEKNGITNKHNTESGQYIAIDAKTLDYVNANTIRFITPTNYEYGYDLKNDHSKDVSQSTNKYEIINELIKLNPNATIYVDALGNVNSSVSPEELVLPTGFYYNEKNGITNKHNTQTGAYISLFLNKIEKKEFNDYKVVNVKKAETKEELLLVKTSIINSLKKLSERINERGKNDKSR